MNVKPGDSLFVSGKYFHPGIVYIRFDGVAVVGTVTGDQWRSAQVLGSTTASQTGAFQTSVTIPTANGGVHYLAIEDTQTILITRVNVTAGVAPTATPTPTAAPTSNPTNNPTPTSTPPPNSSLPTPTIELSLSRHKTSWCI
ncbi:MAG: hypothetical protein M1167_05955 [Chloroflexi bacterium]|nr:hypothetical protein [Chloroflexota bacterium]